ncbi:hypothetical protein [Amycolatopsis magusensis]|uniref:hypothetical protein n=1 Tax=Amycolatopsis magusensis TaxID=882444 RepID=UPI0024A8E82C|nr:hypothetical protein [Amycolatopsis magusensis]MDI5979250.1 hypothetical protein [Amycolatopsis magusensis]
MKNLLFLRGELSDEAGLEQVYDAYWAPFDDEWWKAAVGRGYAQRGRREMLTFDADNAIYDPIGVNPPAEVTITGTTDWPPRFRPRA